MLEYGQAVNAGVSLGLQGVAHTMLHLVQAVESVGKAVYSVLETAALNCYSEEEIQAKLAQSLSTAGRIAILEAKRTFEQCLDRHITELGFPVACEDVALKYYLHATGKNYYNELMKKIT